MLNKLYLMASYAEGPGLLPYHQKHGPFKCKGECQPIFSVPGLNQDIIRPAYPNLRSYQSDKQWKPVNGFPESSQMMKIDSTFARHVLADTQVFIADNLPRSVLFSFGIAERCARHEKVMKLLKSGICGTEKDGLDFSLMSDLIEFQLTITEMHQHHAATKGPRSGSHLMDMEPSFVYPSSAINAQECLETFVGDFISHPAMSVNPDGKISFVGSVTEMKDLLSVLAEFYIPKGSASWSRQTILVPQFKWGGTVETPVFINNASFTLETLRVAPLKSPLKDDKMKSAPRRKTNKKAARERDLHQKNYSHACESFLSLMMNKKQNGRTVINSLKKSGRELPELLSQFSSTIAGTGLAVVFAVIFKITCGRVHFGASKLLTTSLGVGLFWLSSAVNKLRDTIVWIRKNSAKLGAEEEEEIVKKVDKNMNDIFFRVATLTAVAVLSFA